jgi:hypothetical protein
VEGLTKHLHDKRAPFAAESSKKLEETVRRYESNWPKIRFTMYTCSAPHSMAGKDGAPLRVQ